MDHWFAMERNFSGQYVPVIYHGAKPTGKRSTGEKKPSLRNITKIDKKEAKLPLSELEKKYG